MTDYWFKPKTHGYGAYPTSWKGWALIGVFALLQLAMASVLLVPDAAGQQTVDLTRLAGFLLGTAVITAAFLWICMRKTDGEWGWRWPKRTE